VACDIVSSKMFFLLIGTLAITIIIPIVVYSADAASSNSDMSKLVYGCIPQRQIARCNPFSNQFDSLVTTGQVQKLSTVNLTKIDHREGVFGSALSVNGFRQEYFTLLNSPEIDSKIFSVTNSDGKIFTVSSPFETGVFQNVVGTFDEKELKIYVNGYL
jgi:hypothetical protein